MKQISGSVGCCLYNLWSYGQGRKHRRVTFNKVSLKAPHVFRCSSLNLYIKNISWISLNLSGSMLGSVESSLTKSWFVDVEQSKTWKFFFLKCIWIQKFKTRVKASAKEQLKSFKFLYFDPLGPPKKMMGLKLVKKKIIYIYLHVLF